MPYTKRENDKMQMLLKGYGVNGAKLAAALGCSAPTARAKLRDTGRLTLTDVAHIAVRLHIPVDEMRQAIGG